MPTEDEKETALSTCRDSNKNFTEVIPYKTWNLTMNSIDSWDHIIDDECAIWTCAYPKLITLYNAGLSNVRIFFNE